MNEILNEAQLLSFSQNIFLVHWKREGFIFVKGLCRSKVTQSLFDDETFNKLNCTWKFAPLQWKLTKYAKYVECY